MGQKVHPHGLRVGVIKGWDAKWYADKRTFADSLIEDNKIREFVKKELFSAGISKIEIERAAKRVKLNIYTAKPGVVIGKGGAGIEALKAKVAKLVNGKNILINIVEVKNAEANAQLVAENIAAQLEKRVTMDLLKQIQHTEKSELKFVFIMEKFFQLKKLKRRKKLTHKKGGISHVNA